MTPTPEQNPPPLNQKSRRQRQLFYLLILICILPATACLWFGMISTRGGGDSPFLLQRTVDMAESLRYGIFPVRWMAHGAYGLGYPLFNHYAALPYYLTGALTALGLSPIHAIQSVQILGFLLAGLTAALWAAKRFTYRWATLLAVIAYTYAPFHLVNVYVRGDSLSEFYAFVWYPLILWTLDRLEEQFTPGRLAAASLSYGALILTHNVSALIFAPFALLYVLWKIDWKKRFISLRPLRLCVEKSLLKEARWFIPFGLSFLLTAWFWLPAILETRYGQMGPEFTAGYFHYDNHFRGLNLVQTSPAFNYDIGTTVDQAGPFAMGLVQALLAVAGAVVLLRRRRRTDLYLLAGLLLATVMITPLSAPLWKYLPLLGTTQFPWRFLSIQALFAAMAAGALVDFKWNKFPSLTTFLTPLLGGIILLSMLWGLHPDRLDITNADVTVDRLALYESFTGNIGTTIRYEYLPAAVVPRLYTSEAVVAGEETLRPFTTGDADLQAARISRTPNSQSWDLTLSAAAPVVFPLNDWPGWTATVDGQLATSYPITGSGRLTVDLPAGRHTVVLKLGNTPLRTAAETLSLVTLLAGLAAWIWTAFRGHLSFSFPNPLVGILTLGIAVLLALIIPIPSNRPLSWNAPAIVADFVQKPYFHSDVINYGDIFVRIEKTLPERSVPEDTLAVDLNFRALDRTELTGTLRLVSPAEPRHNITYELAQTGFTVTCPGIHNACYSNDLPPLNLPVDLTRGYYLIEMKLYENGKELTPMTENGSPMGALYLGPVRVPHGPALPEGAPLLAQLGELRLHSLEAVEDDPATLRLKMGWSVARRTPRNLSLSLRLMDAEGRTLSTQDLQPGYGYLPTTLWEPGELTTDYPRLPRPEGLAPGHYTLRVIAYQEGTMETVGQADLPITLTTTTQKDPAGLPGPALCQRNSVLLNHLELPDQIVEGTGLDFTAEWSTPAQPAADITATWELLAPDGTVVGTAVGPLAAGSQTSGWPAQAWVRAPLKIALPPLLTAPGPYTLRLSLADAGTPTTCTVAQALPVQMRPRLFTLPQLNHPQEARFGPALRLRGYDLQRDGTKLNLTLWWQTDTAPDRDYKRFIHLFDPATEQVPVQDDAMPRAWSYPTGWWAAGEIVSETVTLDLSAVRAGSYRLSVGWYDPENGRRLPAVDAAGAPLPSDRAVLDQTVEVK